MRLRTVHRTAQINRAEVTPLAGGYIPTKTLGPVQLDFSGQTFTADESEMKTAGVFGGRIAMWPGESWAVEGSFLWSGSDMRATVGQFVVTRDAEVRRALGWDARPVVLTVGRLQKRKGHDMLIRALPAVRRQVPEVLYAIAGLRDFRPSLFGKANTFSQVAAVFFVMLYDIDHAYWVYAARWAFLRAVFAFTIISAVHYIYLVGVRLKTHNLVPPTASRS